MFCINDHRLHYPSDLSRTPLLTWLPSPHYNHNRNIIPQLIVMHYTAGATAKSTAEWCAQPESGVSYHVIIDRDGSLIQQVLFNRRAWHAGHSSWLGHTDVNGFSIGIALANFGWIPDSDIQTHAADIPIVQAAHKNRPQSLLWWESYPRAQLLTLCALVAALVDAYPIRAIAGHDDIAPTRKLDPGPAFYPLPALVDVDVAHPLFALIDQTGLPFQIPE